MASPKSASKDDVTKIQGTAKMWAVYGATFSPCEKAVDTLPAAQYSIDVSQERGIYFTKKEVNLDDLMHLPDSASEQIIAEIELFWSREKSYRDFGFLWKRGVLLWGPPGSGKTSTVQVLSKLIIDRGGISCYISDPRIGAQGLELMRRIEPKRPVVVMLEDIDATIKEYGEQALLALLDGELQIDNVVFVATTNYPQMLDKRITNRPSRFDIVKKIGMPSAAARKVFLRAKNARLETDHVVEHKDDRGKVKTMSEIDAWVEATDSYSIAHLKELIVSVECFGRPFDEVVKRLNKMISKQPSSDDELMGSAGFRKD